ncbi:MAG: hypothetical protein HQL65_07620 [Magnetococcales bacterium]|nr:hypothetical protein [Magnetococcales bacterium]
MFSWQRFQQKRERSRALHAEVLARHDQLVEQTRVLTGTDWLALPDDFNLRFEVLVLLVAVQLSVWRRRAQPEDETRIRLLWEIMFEGFDNTLRQQGVSDIRMASRMRKLLGHATGRRNAYLESLAVRDPQPLHAAIGRNVLNLQDAQTNDPRIQRLLAAIQAMFPSDNFPEDTRTS